jgi:hypothetical protein
MAEDLPVQLHLSSEDAMRAEVIPATNADGSGIPFCKPCGGMWTSTWDQETRISGWVEWCQGEFQTPLVEKYWHLLTPQPGIRVYTIDTYDDLTRLLGRYERRFTGKFASLGFRQNYLDFERLAQDYDAIHMTDDGQWATRLTYPANLYGWDCECTLWFRWCFTEVQRIEPTVTVEDMAS